MRGVRSGGSRNASLTRGFSFSGRNEDSLIHFPYFSLISNLYNSQISFPLISASLAEISSPNSFRWMAWYSRDGFGGEMHNFLHSKNKPILFQSDQKIFS